MELTLEQVQTGLQAGVKKAQEIKVPCSIAIVDSGRNLLGFYRLDGAVLASIETAQGKAYTARSMNMKTGDIMPLVQPGAPLYGMALTHRTPLIVFGGGAPISRNGQVAGAVGVAGGMVEQDEQIAEAVVKAISN
jgi:uncharacterized protein GlcG (DUF336 family)